MCSGQTPEPTPVFITNGFSSLQSSNSVLRVLVPERLGQPALLPGNVIQLQFNDADGGALLTTNDVATFTVYASTNLIGWFPITNALTVTNGSIIFSDSITNKSPTFALSRRGAMTKVQLLRIAAGCYA